MRFSAFALPALAVLTACAPAPAPESGAGLALNISIPHPTYAPHAAAVTDETLLQDIKPTKLQILVCDKVALSKQVKVFCSVEQKDYNHLAVIENIGNGSGSAEIAEVPAGENQVIIAQGLNAEDRINYQGFATQPVIAPRGRYSVDIELVQVYFPQLPPPAKPVLIEPAASPVSIAANVNKFTFKGTREADTILKATTPGDFGLGGVRRFNGSEGNFYTETKSGDTITWQLDVTIPLRQPSFPKRYPVDFAATRIGEERYSDAVTAIVDACAYVSGTSGPEICP